MALIRRLNEVGIARFQDFLNGLNVRPDLPLPLELLEAEETSTALDVSIEIDPIVFGNRLEAVKYLDARVGDGRLKNVERDRELWAWLSLFFFDELCPAAENGKRKVLKNYHYIPVNTDYRLYYRHLLAGPYRIYRAHRVDPDRALVFLIGPLHVVGHFMYQLASRQEIVTNPAVVAVATKLYVDREKKSIKRGAVSFDKAGSVFRFVSVLNQLDLTWDLYAITPERLMACLPAEFDIFRGKTPRKHESKSAMRVEPVVA